MENLGLKGEPGAGSRLRIQDAKRESKEALLAEILRLRRYVKELEQAADKDALASVYNRRAFLRELVRAQSVYQRYQIPTSLIYLDLDGFKSVNDRFGHIIGDELLIKAGNVFQANVRDCDLVARLGGDEFGLLLFKTELDQALDKAASLAKSIAKIEIKMPTSTIQITVSWGCSAVVSGKTPERIISEADQQMYHNKRLKPSLSD